MILYDFLLRLWAAFWGRDIRSITASQTTRKAWLQRLSLSELYEWMWRGCLLSSSLSSAVFNEDRSSAHLSEPNVTEMDLRAIVLPRSTGTSDRHALMTERSHQATLSPPAEAILCCVFDVQYLMIFMQNVWWILLFCRPAETISWHKSRHKSRHKLARFRLYRHRFLQLNTRFAAFF